MTHATLLHRAMVCTAMMGGLYGCVSPTLTPTVSVLPANVQAAVLAACAISVPISDIANVLAAGTAVAGSLGTVETWATLICRSFENAPPAAQRGGRMTVQVHHVFIHGTRV